MPTTRDIARLLMVAVLAASAMCAQGSATAASVKVGAGDVVATVDEHFLGFTTDWWLPVGPYGDKWGRGGILDVDLSNANLRAMVSALTPATWRVGGTPEDTAVYDIGNPPQCPIPHQNPYPGVKCLNMTRWGQIVDFAEATGVQLMFGLNGWYGRPAGGKEPMNVTNAASLLQYTAEQGLNVYGFELSNEDNTPSLAEQDGKNVYIDPTVLGHDIGRIRGIINSVWADTAPEKRPILVGPDTAVDVSWDSAFLEAAGDAINATTYHAYAGAGFNPQLLQQLLTPSYLEQTHSVAATYLAATAKASPGLDVWGGEIGPAYGGGRANVTNTFADAFWYLDHLGELSAQGVKRFLRSTLIGGDYELVDHETYLPNPDYFAALLWSRLAGPQALKTTVGDSDTVVAYATCSGGNKVAVLVLNMDTASATVDVAVASSSPQLQSGQQSEYHVRAAAGIVTASQAEILAPDGKSWTPLRLGSDGSVPTLSPYVQAAGSPVAMEPYSYAFVVVDAECGASV